MFLIFGAVGHETVLKKSLIAVSQISCSSCSGLAVQSTKFPFMSQEREITEDAEGKIRDRVFFV